MRCQNPDNPDRQESICQPEIDFSGAHVTPEQQQQRPQPKRAVRIHFSYPRSVARNFGTPPHQTRSQRPDDQTPDPFIDHVAHARFAGGDTWSPSVSVPPHNNVSQSSESDRHSFDTSTRASKNSERSVLSTISPNIQTPLATTGSPLPQTIGTPRQVLFSKGSVRRCSLQTHTVPTLSTKSVQLRCKDRSFSRLHKRESQVKREPAKCISPCEKPHLWPNPETLPSQNLNTPASRICYNTRKAQNFSRPRRGSRLSSHAFATNFTFALPSVGQQNDSKSKPDSVEESIDDTVSDSQLASVNLPAANESKVFEQVSPIIQPESDGNNAKESSTRASFDSAVNESLGDKRLELEAWEIWTVRCLFTCFVFGVNIALGLAYLSADKHPYLLGILVFMKSKDVISTIIDIFGLLFISIRQVIWPYSTPKSQWILSMVCAYAETDEQIMKTVSTLAAGTLTPHKQVICVILDGKPRDIVSRMTETTITIERPYTTWRGARGEIQVTAGYVNETPLLLVEKKKNAGKKDSLILGHDLFNFPRDDMPESTKLLRREVWESVLPTLVSRNDFEAFGFVFCTDADSTIHKHALQRLANALSHDSSAIAACGVLFAEFGGSWTELSPWHLFQQFQYTFGQYVRRQAEGMWGRVTCLPGCITMIAVRPEMGKAITQYARPVTEHNLWRHQVQYLGTDRRLTWCMTSQNKHLRTIFVPDALSETVVPDTLSHYLSQRRRWASNAYFNDYFYALGPRQRLITRLFALIDVVRLSLVFYRVFNTAYFLHGLITNYYFIKIIPTLIVTKTPAMWYLIMITIKESHLRRRLHKLMIGMCINQIISPFLSVIVFANVILHIGSQSWGKTGKSTGPSTIPTQGDIAGRPATSDNLWTPNSLGKLVSKAVHGTNPIQIPPTQVQTPGEIKAEQLRIKGESTDKDLSDSTAITTSRSVAVDDEVNVSKVCNTLLQTPIGLPTASETMPAQLSHRTPHRLKRNLKAFQTVSETPTRIRLQESKLD